MADDDRVQACDDRVHACEYVDEITKLLHRIDDPAQLSNVRDWVVKLTADGGGGGLETDYLRLLEYALKSRDGATAELRGPFDAPPPDGPLVRPSAGTARRTVSLAAGGTGPPDPGPDEVDGGGTVTVRELVAAARRHAPDGGALMDRAVRELLDDYGRVARAAFDDRADRLGDALAKEQAALMSRYRAGMQRALSRAQILQDHVRELMPAFQWDEYAADPDGYVRRAVHAKKRGGATAAVDVRDAADDDDHGALHDDDDENGTVASTRRKKSMATLDWLRSEMERADCETTELADRHDAVMVALGIASKRKMANECEARAQRLEAKVRLDELRQQSARQVVLIDSLVKTLSSDADGGGGGARC